MKRVLRLRWFVPRSFRFVSFLVLVWYFFLTLCFFCCLYYRRLFHICQCFFDIFLFIFFCFVVIVCNNFKYYRVFLCLFLYIFYFIRLFCLFCAYFCILNIIWLHMPSNLKWKKTSFSCPDPLLFPVSAFYLKPVMETEFGKS